MDKYDRLIELGKLKNRLIEGLCSDLSMNRILSSDHQNQSQCRALVNRHCSNYDKLNTAKPSDAMIEMIAELFPLMTKMWLNDNTYAVEILREMWRYAGYEPSSNTLVETSKHTIRMDMTLFSFRIKTR
jgi:hypothetical protein